MVHPDHNLWTFDYLHQGKLATLGHFRPTLATLRQKRSNMGLFNNSEPSRCYQWGRMIQHDTILGFECRFFTGRFGEKMVVLTLKAPLEAVRDDDLTFSIKLPNIGLPNQMVTLAPFPLGVK